MGRQGIELGARSLVADHGEQVDIANDIAVLPGQRRRGRAGGRGNHGQFAVFNDMNPPARGSDQKDRSRQESGDATNLTGVQPAFTRKGENHAGDSHYVRNVRYYVTLLFVLRVVDTKWAAGQEALRP